MCFGLACSRAEDLSVLNCRVLRRVDFLWHLFSRVCLSELLSWALNFLFRFYPTSRETTTPDPKRDRKNTLGASWAWPCTSQDDREYGAQDSPPKSNRQNRLATQIAISHTLAWEDNLCQL